MTPSRLLIPFAVAGLLAACTPASPSSGDASSASSASAESSAGMTSVSLSSSSSTSAVAVEGTRMDEKAPYEFSITTPYALEAGQKEANFWTGDSTVEFTGTAGGPFEKLVVTHMPDYGDDRDRDVYQSQGFKPGDKTWRYVASVSAGNLKKGMNEYVFRFYTKEGTYVEKTFWLAYNVESSSQPALTGGQPLNVVWSEPKKMDTVQFLKDRNEYDRTMRRMQVSYEGGGMTDDLKVLEDRVVQGMEYYVVGKVQGGKYDGSDVILAIIDFCLDIMGPCGSRMYPQDYVRTKDGTFVRFERDANVWFETTLDAAYALDVNAPATIRLPAGGKLVNVETQGRFTVSGASLFTSAETGRPLYEDSRSCMLSERSDGTTAVYDLDLSPYLDADNKLSFTANDGKTYTDTYLKVTHRGCAFGYYCAQTVPVKNAGGALTLGDEWGRALEKVGTLKNGEAVYREKYSAQEIAGFKDSVTSGDLSQTYAMLPSWEGSPAIPAPQAFYDSYPVVYVKDPLGRYLRFQKEKYQSGAECGKPVIYLYPEEETDVRVEVKPVGGLTISEPAYDGGWNVRAWPDGRIFDYATQKTYPYLFWEGDGGEYEIADEGFVMPREEVHAFLLEVLATLGMNSVETADFLEFWEPKLTASPWVFITFVPQETFETMAPLTVTPAPDTVIRVFMDFQPLDAPKSVEPQYLSPRVRSGFTVVEWGGVLHSGDSKDDLIYQSAPLR